MSSRGSVRPSKQDWPGHDGAQQNLVALKVKLGLAEAFAEKDPVRARELVGQLKADADDALETLRDLARGIYPPLLADMGLAAALEAQARKATVPVEVSADGIGRYPQDIEAAVYFCALEALQNIQKYANASRASVTLSVLSGDLRLEVEDDGGGFDAATIKPGTGLQNMKDRLEALGGAVDMTRRLAAAPDCEAGCRCVSRCGPRDRHELSSARSLDRLGKRRACRVPWLWPIRSCATSIATRASGPSGRGA